jgi:hypothetical protein
MRNYRDILREDLGYDDELLATMTDEDCEAEYVEVTSDGANF